jgi:hypothetical protein
MATWESLKSYLLSILDADNKSPGLIAARLTFPDGESRVTFVSSAEDHQGNPWTSIDSIVTTMASVDLGRAVRLMGEKACGGMATMPIGDQEYLVVRHAMPISGLSGERIDEFMVPFYAVTGAASGLAKELAEFNPL